MVKVVLQGWEEGFEKVSLTKIQMNILGFTLQASKQNVDRLLNDEEVVIQVHTLALASEFIVELNKIGVKYTLIE